MFKTFDKTKFVYTSQFCEENVYKMMRSLVDTYDVNPSHLYAMFITNPPKSAMICSQKLGTESKDTLRGCVRWDYHVVMIYSNQDEKTLKQLLMSTGSKRRSKKQKAKSFAHVYDFDSTLPFPTSLTKYLKESLPEHQPVDTICLRVVPATYLFHTFSSDRSHMKGQRVVFPTYHPIRPNRWDQSAAVSNNTLPEYLDTSSDAHGSWFQREEVLRLFEGKKKKKTTKGRSNSKRRSV